MTYYGVIGDSLIVTRPGGSTLNALSGGRLPGRVASAA
jgi:hypothetical protein